MLKQADIEALKKKIVQKCRAFDFLALFQILAHMGYRFDDIFFKSHIGTESQTNLIQAVEFQDGIGRHVIVSLNLGLLSAQGLLPSYFFKKMETDAIDEKAFCAFIGYFDHFLIRGYLLNLYPEINKRAIPDWEQTKRRYLSMMDLKSDKTLYFIFRHTFPELGIQVQKRTFKRHVETTHPIIGESRLGDNAVFGSVAQVPAYGKQVVLYSDGEVTGSGLPWPNEIKARLADLIFPRLRPVSIDLEIVLVIRSQKGWAKLDAKSYLGFDKIQGGKSNYRKIRIFRGEVV